ncbi:hypothetical protein LXL04_004784 [Taraxacum kok-saghyz]
MILERYKMGNSSQNENVCECIQITALNLRLTSSTALVIEQISIKNLLIQLREKDNKQQKKQILRILLDVLKNHGNLFTSVNVDNHSIAQKKEYRSQRVDSYVNREEPPKSITGIPPEECKCLISCKVMYDSVVIDSGERIKDRRRAVFETEEFGVSILQDLHQQRQTLLNSLAKRYLASFEILYDTILEAMLKLDEKIKEATKKFPINPKINDWRPIYNDFFGLNG